MSVKDTLQEQPDPKQVLCSSSSEEQIRDRVLEPSPHVALHLDQDDQGPQPSVAEDEIYEEI